VSVDSGGYGHELNDSSVPFGPINNIQQTFDHPQAVARGVVVEVEVRIPASLLIPLLNFAPSTRALERLSWWGQLSGTTGERCQ
jgi:crotonobetainyl-CoA:carnitine CoA-transferase CaiB-like acyl-CoA transferase